MLSGLSVAWHFPRVVVAAPFICSLPAVVVPRRPVEVTAVAAATVPVAVPVPIPSIVAITIAVAVAVSISVSVTIPTLSATNWLSVAASPTAWITVAESSAAKAARSLGPVIEARATVVARPREAAVIASVETWAQRGTRGRPEAVAVSSSRTVKATAETATTTAAAATPSTAVEATTEAASEAISEAATGAHGLEWQGFGVIASAKTPAQSPWRPADDCAATLDIQLDLSAFDSITIASSYRSCSPSHKATLR